MDTTLSDKIQPLLASEFVPTVEADDFDVDAVAGLDSGDEVLQIMKSLVFGLVGVCKAGTSAPASCHQTILMTIKSFWSYRPNWVNMKLYE